MAGIYLHIPFCKQACHYCNFHFSTSLRYKADVVGAIAAEARLRRPYLGADGVATVYFGGGTPSLLTVDECRYLLATLRDTYDIDPAAEITLEANPDDITADRLAAWRTAGINRLSIGTQSFFDDELRWMNRAHTAAHALDCIRLAHAEGFGNISIDLIYGSPLLTDGRWRENVDTAIGLGIPHLSCYALTVEEKTPLHKHIARGEKTEPANEDAARQFALLMGWLRAAGYEHYEVSNFARPGARSRHNTAYWQGVPYLGLGPSAHSFNGTERSWNVANNALYTAGVQAGLLHREAETLSPADRLNEAVMISLRTAEGLDLARIEREWGPAEKSRLEQGLQRFSATGLLVRENNTARLTDEGMLRADGIAAALFK